MMGFPLPISLCMIVRNEEEHLEECLSSVRKLVSEIIIVDTGSGDSTKDIAGRFGSKIFDFQWNGDFSSARNFSISKAAQGWILILDADEAISEMDFSKIENLIQGEADAYFFDCRTYTNNINVAGWTSSKGDIYPESRKAGGFRVEKILRFFRNKGYYFEGKIHETVSNSIKKIGGDILNSNVVIHHFGQINPNKIRNKKELYVIMLKKRLDEKDFNEKTEDFICWELSRELGQMGRNDEALYYLERAAKIKEEYLYLLGLGGLYIMKKRLDDAEKVLKKAVVLNPFDSSVHLNLGVIYSERGDYSKAVKKFERAIELNPGSANAYYNLGVVYLRKGKKDFSTRFFDKAVELNPDYKDKVPEA